MFELFRKKPAENPFQVDLHSHLIPGIDDGAKTVEESEAMIRKLHALGYNHFITTPHVMGDFYPNNPKTIREGLDHLLNHLSSTDLDCTVEAAAEYHLDEKLMSDLESGMEILTFGDNYFLFEGPFMNEPVYLKELIFSVTSKGLKPVLAHPERYAWLMNNTGLLEELSDRGVLLQINLLSLAGYYSAPVKKFAEKLIREGRVSFYGSDCHNEAHADALRKSMDHSLIRKFGDQALNNSLQ